MSLQNIKDSWQDTPEYHSQIHNRFVEAVNSDPELNAQRTWVEQNIWGFGERSFQWLWKLIVDEMPQEFKFMEIGLFKGQILSLVGLLAKRTGKASHRYGISPLDETGVNWLSDYSRDIEVIHEQFNVPKDYTIYQGLSNNVNSVKNAFSTSPYDCVYIDGDHTFEIAFFDLETYGAMVKVGGYLVIDDCNCDLNFPPSGFFTGIADVTDAKRAWWEINKGEWEFVFSVVHIAVYRRIK